MTAVSSSSGRQVRAGDTVYYLGARRQVQDMRALSGGDRLLFLEGGYTCRLSATGADGPVPASGWHTEPDTAQGAPPVTYALQCVTCRRHSGPHPDQASTHRWVESHLRQRPAHTAYRELTTRPWRARRHPPRQEPTG